MMDDECHVLTQCTVGAEARVGMYEGISNSNSVFPSLSSEHQFKMLVCASSPRDVKLVSRYLQTIFDTRDRIDQTGRVG